MKINGKFQVELKTVWLPVLISLNLVIRENKTEKSDHCNTYALLPTGNYYALNKFFFFNLKISWWQVADWSCWTVSSHSIGPCCLTHSTKQRYEIFCSSHHRECHDHDNPRDCQCAKKVVLGNLWLVDFAMRPVNSVLCDLGHFPLVTASPGSCFLFPEFPPSIIDNAKHFSGDELKKKLDAAAMIVKTCYW